MPPPPRGTCPVCKRKVGMTKTGRVRVHKDPNVAFCVPRCEGSGYLALELQPSRNV